MNASSADSLDEDPRARAAVLAALPNTPAAPRGRRLQVGVGEDDVGGLAAELERHALDRLRRAAAIARPTSVEP
jgi:hypothetical protein